MHVVGRDFSDPRVPEEGRDFWGFPAGGGPSISSWGPAPSYIRYWLSSHYLQKQCNKYKAFTHTRVLNNLSFMTYPEGILSSICLLFSFGMFFLCYSGISKLSSTDLTHPLRTESLSLLRKQTHANLNQVITSQSPWSVNPSFSFSIASPSSSEKTGSRSCCLFSSAK